MTGTPDSAIFDWTCYFLLEQDPVSYLSSSNAPDFLERQLWVRTWGLWWGCICKSLRGGLFTDFPAIGAIHDSFLKRRFIIHYHSHHSPPLMPLESISFMHSEHSTPRVLFLRVTYQRSLGEWTAVDLRAAPSTSHLLPSLSILFWLHFSPTAQLISTIL